IGATMNLTSEKSDAFNTLVINRNKEHPGTETIIFSESDDYPLKVFVDFPGKAPPTSPENELVIKHMQNIEEFNQFRTLYLPHPECEGIDKNKAYRAFELAKEIVENSFFRRDFIRFVLSITDSEADLKQLSQTLLARIKSFLNKEIDEKLLLLCLSINASEWFANKRGSQLGKTFAETTNLSNELKNVLFSIFKNED